MKVGSQEWIDFWAIRFWNAACKDTDSAHQFVGTWLETVYIEEAMFNFFMYEFWSNREAWA